MLFKLAIRNLLRHRWRSALTAGGVAVATFVLVWTMCWIDSFLVVMVQGATAVDTGQIQITSQAHTEKANIYSHFPTDSAKLDEVRAVDGVAGATTRVNVYGLVGNEERSQVARLVGVDAVHEGDVSGLPDGVDEGRWLSDEPPEAGPREVLLGAAFARLLEVGVGDELVVFLQAADGSLGNDLLKVVGTIKSGSTAVDRGSVYLHGDDLRWIASLEGKSHQVLLAVDNLDQSRVLAEEIQKIIGTGPTMDNEPGSALVARSWQDVVPELAQMIEVSTGSIWIMYLIIYLIAALGIVNTQRMSALERRREFGVLLAIGLTPPRLGWMIVLETVMLTAAGALVGLFGGLALAWYHATAGFDMTSLTDSGSFDYMGVAFDERIYFVINAASVLQPVAIIVLVALVCGLWPAIKSARLDAIRAIAGRT